MKIRRHHPFAIAGALALGLACSSTAPSSELKTARDAVKNAPGTGISQDDLASARLALQAAEVYHQQSPGSAEEKSQAYVATRRVQLGEAKAKERKMAEARALAAQAESSQAATLEQTQRELAEAQKEAADAQQQLRALEASQASGLAIAGASGIRFETGSAELSVEAQSQLDALAQELQGHPDQQLVIQGYADAQGDKRFNQELSQRRADAVRDQLVASGVAADRLRAMGLGESFPVATNATPEGRADNRRVELAMAPATTPSVANAPAAKPAYPEPERKPVSGKDTDTKGDPRQPDDSMPPPSDDTKPPPDWAPPPQPSPQQY